MSKKNRKSKHDKPTKGVFIAVDETTSPGAKYVIVVAAVTKDRRAFRDIVENENLDYEIGFSSDKERAPKILGSAGPLIEMVYAAYIPQYAENPYIKLLSALNDAIPYDPEKPLLIMVDANEGFDSHLVESIFKKGKKKGDSASVVVVPSNFFCEMQTHDFITGAVGAEINHGNDHWTKMLPKGIIKTIAVPVKSENRKGRTSSTRTPSPLAGLRVQPLRGQCTGTYGYDADAAIRTLPGKNPHSKGSEYSNGTASAGRASAEHSENHTDGGEGMTSKNQNGRTKTVEVREDGRLVGLFSSEVKADSFRKELSADGRRSTKYIQYEGTRRPKAPKRTAPAGSRNAERKGARIVIGPAGDGVRVRYGTPGDEVVWLVDYIDVQAVGHDDSTGGAIWEIVLPDGSRGRASFLASNYGITRPTIQSGGWQKHRYSRAVRGGFRGLQDCLLHERFGKYGYDMQQRRRKDEETSLPMGQSTI